MNINLDQIFDAVAERVASKVIEKMGATAPANRRLMSVEDAAVYLGRKPESVRGLLQNGALKAVRLDGRVFLDRVEIDRAIEDAKRGRLK